MDSDLKTFSSSQQQALFDLLILAMYADGHLAATEDEQQERGKHESRRGSGNARTLGHTLITAGGLIRDALPINAKFPLKA